ncbi:hypothetical protein [Salinactinospora qingdaonensis]|uniref:Immunity protein 17 n=1 Tax=Salinactinospora qingdaonensis TaxID=702744 RepID=A0ABP7FJ50_9ACTN
MANPLFVFAVSLAAIVVAILNIFYYDKISDLTLIFAPRYFREGRKKAEGSFMDKVNKYLLSFFLGVAGVIFFLAGVKMVSNS